MPQGATEPGALAWIPLSRLCGPFRQVAWVLAIDRSAKLRNERGDYHVPAAVEREDPVRNRRSAGAVDPGRRFTNFGEPGSDQKSRGSRPYSVGASNPVTAGKAYSGGTLAASITP